MLLSRYTGQDDIVVGSPSAGRNRAETKSVIRFFLNTLVLRTDLSGDPTFRELLEQVRETTVDAYKPGRSVRGCLKSYSLSATAARPSSKSSSTCSTCPPKTFNAGVSKLSFCHHRKPAQI